jgi:hypothetical protein
MLCGKETFAGSWGKAWGRQGLAYRAKKVIRNVTSAQIENVSKRL